MSLQAGDLSKRITILSPFVKVTPSGQKVTEYHRLMDLWAQVKCAGNKVLTDDGAIVHDTEYRFYVRRRSDITDGMRVQWRGRTFELTGPPLDWLEDSRWMTLVTREVR